MKSLGDRMDMLVPMTQPEFLVFMEESVPSNMFKAP